MPVNTVSRELHGQPKPLPLPLNPSERIWSPSLKPDRIFKITARIDHLSDGVGCFDPIQVIYRMRVAFPQLIEHSRDYFWETCDRIRKSTAEGSDGALRIAVRDMQERGPKILFEIPLAGGRVITGTAERYWIHVFSTHTFPEEFQQAFTRFLNDLKFQPVQVSNEAA